MKRQDILISVLLVLGVLASLISDFCNVLNIPIIALSIAYIYVVYKTKDL